MNGCVVEAVAPVSNERDSKISYTSIGVQCKNKRGDNAMVIVLEAICSPRIMDLTNQQLLINLK